MVTYKAYLKPTYRPFFFFLCASYVVKFKELNY